MNYQVGDTLPERNFGPLSRTDFVRYQGASGDFNPIHHDETYAQAAGFPSVFSVGMLQAGYLATYSTDLFGPDNVRGFKVRFREQVWPGDVLTCSGTVTGVEDDEISLDLTVITQDGKTAIQGTATFAAN
jgi:acyl dehydratase